MESSKSTNTVGCRPPHLKARQTHGGVSGCHSVDATPYPYHRGESEEERLQQAHLEALQWAETLGEERRQAEEVERIANEAAKRAGEELAKATAAREAKSSPASTKPTRVRPRPPREPPPDWTSVSAAQWPPAKGGKSVREPEWPKPGEWKPVLLKPPAKPAATTHPSKATMAEPELTEKFKEALSKGAVEIDETLGKFYTWKGMTYREKVNPSSGVNSEHSMETIYEYVTNAPLVTTLKQEDEIPFGCIDDYVNTMRQSCEEGVGAFKWPSYKFGFMRAIAVALHHLPVGHIVTIKNAQPILK